MVSRVFTLTLSPRSNSFTPRGCDSRTPVPARRFQVLRSRTPAIQHLHDISRPPCTPVAREQHERVPFPLPVQARILPSRTPPQNRVTYTEKPDCNSHTDPRHCYRPTMAQHAKSPRRNTESKPRGAQKTRDPLIRLARGVTAISSGQS